MTWWPSSETTKTNPRIPYYSLGESDALVLTGNLYIALAALVRVPDKRALKKPIDFALVGVLTYLLLGCLSFELFEDCEEVLSRATTLLLCVIVNMNKPLYILCLATFPSHIIPPKCVANTRFLHREANRCLSV